MRINFDRLKQYLADKYNLFDQSARAQATDVIEWEQQELEHIFSVLVCSTFIGMPAPPLQITLDLLPHMEKELSMMLEKVDTAAGPLSDLFSLLNIG